MDRAGNAINFDRTERRAACLPAGIQAGVAPSIFNNLVVEIQRTGEDRRDLDDYDPWEMHPAVRLTRMASLETRLTVLDRMKRELGTLAAAEIVHNSLEGIKGLDLTRLHEK